AGTSHSAGDARPPRPALGTTSDADRIRPHPSPERAERVETTMPDTESPLFRPLTVRSRELRNRIVMSPMTRSQSPGGVPGPDVVEYYRRRAAGGTALIVTEGVAIDHPTAVDNPRVPHMYGEAALDGWRCVVD